MTKVLTCKCKHEFQDREYGESKRLHNQARVHPKPFGKGWRCTVCNEVKGK